MTSQSLCNVLETRKRSGNAGFLGFAQIAQGGRLPIIHLKLPKPHSRALPFFEPRFDQLESFIKAFRNFNKTCSLQMVGIDWKLFLMTKRLKEVEGILFELGWSRFRSSVNPQSDLCVRGEKVVESVVSCDRKSWSMAP